MRQSIGGPAIAVMAAFFLVSAAKPGPGTYTEDFGLDKSDLSSTGTNPYFILEPGYRLSYDSKNGHLDITVLNETKTVDGVETRVVEERESKNGVLEEVSRNYFAISKRTNSVFYFGEDSAEYDAKGTVVSRGGSWEAGVNGAKAGLIMPGLPLLAARYQQEVAPGEAMDRAEIVSLNESVQMPAGKFENVLKIEETTPLEPSEKEYKYYARGVGQLKDGNLELVSHGITATP